MRLGLFGGTFDPIHLGHLIVAEHAREALGLDRVDFVPAGDPWQKQNRGVSPARVRLEMVRAATADNPGFGVETCEIARQGPSYTVDTLREIRGRLGPEAKLFLLVGADAASGFDTWQEPGSVRGLCTLVVLRRPDADVPSFDPPVTVVDAPLVAISATEIRDRVRRGRSIRYRVPDSVAGIIVREGLYR